MTRALHWLGIVTGGVLGLLGVACVAMYVQQGILQRLGEPDQSLIFWYLPVLFLGLMAFIAGVGLVGWGVSRIRHARRG